MKFTRQQYLDILTFGECERPMFVELFGPLIGLEDEWRAQGAGDEEIDLVAFDWDWVPRVGCGGATGAIGLPEAVTLEETDAYLIQRDGLGRTKKLIKSTATIALPLDFPVRTMDDWLPLKPHFQYSDGRIDWEAVDAAKAAQAEGCIVLAGIPGGFDLVRELMGEEEGCVSFYSQPELIHDMLDTVGDTCVRVFEQITERLTIDKLSVHEDMAGKSGPLVGPVQIDAFIGPYYQRVWEVVSGRGTRLFGQDSDGNMNPVIDAFLAAGVNSMHPFEPAAGMDMVATRQQYGRRLSIMGGIDKHVLRAGKEEIRRELEYKMQPLMREGGTIFGLDHRIPNGTPLENYRYYVQLGREILGLPPADGSSRGWARMAF